MILILYVKYSSFFVSQTKYQNVNFSKGIDTTAHTASFLAYHLAINPDKQVFILSYKMLKRMYYFFQDKTYFFIQQTYV